MTAPAPDPRRPAPPALGGAREAPSVGLQSLLERPGELVVEEWLDGLQISVRPSSSGSLEIWSDSGVLDPDGAHAEPTARLVAWLGARSEALRSALGDRWVAHGTWLHARRRIFYDHLPDWFLLEDLGDRSTGELVDRARRAEWAAPLQIALRPELHRGPLELAALEPLLQRSPLRTRGWRAALAEAARTGENALWGTVEEAIAATDDSGLAAGLELRVEHEGTVTARARWLRRSFTPPSDVDWVTRPVVTNARART